MMSNRRERVRFADKVTMLRSTDRAMLSHLDELRRAQRGNICKASIPNIALACGISQRQVQVSASRLIKAGLLERIGYDFSNTKRRARGTIYKVLISPAEMDTNLPAWRLERTVRRITERQMALESCIKGLTFTLDKLLSEFARRQEQGTTLSGIKRSIRNLDSEQQRMLGEWLEGALKTAHKRERHHPQRAPRKRENRRKAVSYDYGLGNTRQ